MNKEHALYPLVRDNITFDTLWQQAMETITSLSGTIWTDTGDHDPGVTLLQAAAYTVSDLSYRASLPLNDLLSDERTSSHQGIFPEAFGPEQTLTCGPVTTQDYRRALRDLHGDDIAALTSGSGRDFLLYDACLVKEPEENRFSWYYHAKDKTYRFNSTSGDVKQTLRGNYWLYLIPTRYTENVSQTERLAINQYINNFLTNNRNLGEKVSQINWLKPVDIDLHLTIELQDDVEDITALAVSICHCIERQLLPAGQRYTTAQLRDAGYSSEATFTGPMLKHGWLPDLPPAPEVEKGIKITLSPLVNQLLAIPGVAGIENLQIKPTAHLEAVTGDSWSWTLAAGWYPRLWGKDLAARVCGNNSPLTLVMKGGISPRLDQQALARALAPAAATVTNPEPVLTGKGRDLSHYTPVGDRLPECYQSRYPATEPHLRQLHQFLLPVDQLLADCAAQLKLLPRLMAFQHRGNQIYGNQWPYAPQSVNQRVHHDYAPGLQEMGKKNAAIFSEDEVINEQNFNHELDCLQYLLSYFGAERAARPLTLDRGEFLATQRGWLAGQPELGYARVNVRIDSVSALQKRLAARLGLGGECFKQHPDLSKLPFYLIEHRQLLPAVPVPEFNKLQTPKSVRLPAAGQKYLILEQDGIAGKLRVGQLIDLSAEGGAALTVNCQMIARIENNTFMLEPDNSQQLKRNLARIKEAAEKKTLRWCNSDTWLQDMKYSLHYADTQPSANTERLLASSAQSPFPVMAKVNDQITIVPYGIKKEDSHNQVAWQLNATIKAIDRVKGTLLIEKTGGVEAFPATGQSHKYVWFFTQPQGVADKDRFSFVVSLVCNRALLQAGAGNIDPYKLESWLQQVIRSEMPAHIVLLTHWLDSSAFNNFALSYQNWQNGGTPLGDAAWQLLHTLTLGQIMSTPLGIGTMRIANDTQSAQVKSQKGSDWENYITENGLFYIPPKDSKSNNRIFI